MTSTRRMTELKESDIRDFIADFELYCGTIREITDVHGPHGGDFFSTFGGIVHTWMDSFNFTVMGLFTDDEAWGLRLTNPVESLRKGHRHEVGMKVPKIHKDPSLVQRYHLANRLYNSYNAYSNVTENSRIIHLEEALGYSHLPTYMSVVNAIVDDFRSYQENKDKERIELNKKN